MKIENFDAIDFSVIFIIIMVVYLILSRNKHSINTKQATITALGMLGTFMGIFLGLWQFDTDNINESVPALLEGLKFAFMSSIAGLILSIGLRILELFNKDKTSIEKDKKDELLDMILDELKSINKSFDEFTEKMAEQNIQALVEAVNQVMEEFNQKINDKLGESFNRLSQASEKLTKWQENNMEQMEKLLKLMQQHSELIKQSSKTLGEINAHAKEFTKTEEKLRESLDALGASLVGIKELANQIPGSADIIKKEIKSITHDVLQDLGQKLAAISEKLVEDYSTVQRAIKKISELHR